MRPILFLTTLVLGGFWIFGCADNSSEEVSLKTVEHATESSVEHQYYAQTSEYFLDVGGARVRLKEEGPQEAPAIILLHGFTMSLESWDAWAAKLSDDYRVIRYDLLGHGLTGPDPLKRYSPIERADFLIELMDALNIEHAILSGNSLGGTIAWRAAIKHPERIDKLVLLSPAFFDFSGVENAPGEPSPQLKVTLETAPLPALQFMATLNYTRPESVTPERLKLMQEMMQNEGNGQAFLDHIAEFTMPDPSRELAELETPTLILWGEKDLIIPSQQGARAAEVMPNAKLQIIENAGHVLQEDAPLESANAALTFLQEAKP